MTGVQTCALPIFAAPNLNWYLTEGLRAHSNDKFGLAAEYYKEFLLLAERVDAPAPDLVWKARVHLGALLLDFDHYEPANEQFDQIPISFENYTAGFLKETTLRCLDRDDDADAVLDEIIETSTGAVRERAISKKEKWNE
mgnify:CR=1 FL=1